MIYFNLLIISTKNLITFQNNPQSFIVFWEVGKLDLEDLVKLFSSLPNLDWAQTIRVGITCRNIVKEVRPLEIYKNV